MWIFRPHRLTPCRLRSRIYPHLHASSAEVEGYFEHLQQSLEQSGFINLKQLGLIMQRLRRLYLRSELTRNEVNILRGIITAMQKAQD
jgi:tRNA C32,U32 (ribose-2'-O)-methylase TrmJ